MKIIILLLYKIESICSLGFGNIIILETFVIKYIEEEMQIRLDMHSRYYYADSVVKIIQCVIHKILKMNAPNSIAMIQFS